MSDEKPFERDVELNAPGIVGARWWHRALVEEDLQVTRRTALTGLLTAGAALAGIAVVGAGIYEVADTGPEARIENQASLAAQRAHGWDFGARGEPLVFDGESHQPFDRAALATLEYDLTPKRYQALNVPTLLQSPGAMPTLPPIDGEPDFVALKNVLKPVFTPAMDRVYQAGQALAAQFHEQGMAVAVVVDLVGAESVAFAAGAATDLEPVFGFDNWPHPRGVVPAHLPLGAAAYYQPLFARRRADRPLTASPLFLLDRHRLDPYVDEADRFDNRHVAKLPSAAALKALGISKVLYVVPTAASLPELDDLNDLFVAYGAEHIEVRATTLDRFTAAPAADAGPQPDFWTDYGWTPPYVSAEHEGIRTGVTRSYELAHVGEAAGANSADVLAGIQHVVSGARWPELGYVPAARTTPFSHATTPPLFGAVGVAVAVGSGLVLGARFARQGSWRRSSSNSGSSWSFGGG